jgi:hypothetical protein
MIRTEFAARPASVRSANQLRKEVGRLVFLRAVVPRDPFRTATAARLDPPLPAGVVQDQEPVDAASDTCDGLMLHCIRWRGVGHVGLVWGDLVNVTRSNDEVLRKAAHGDGTWNHVPDTLALWYHPGGVNGIAELRHLDR